MSLVFSPFVGHGVAACVYCCELQLAGGVGGRVWGWVWWDRRGSEGRPLCQGPVRRQSNCRLRRRWTLSPPGERSTVGDCRMHRILHCNSLDLFHLVRGLAAADHCVEQFVIAGWHCLLTINPTVWTCCYDRVSYLKPKRNLITRGWWHHSGILLLRPLVNTYRTPQ